MAGVQAAVEDPYGTLAKGEAKRSLSVQKIPRLAAAAKYLSKARASQLGRALNAGTELPKAASQRDAPAGGFQMELERFKNHQSALQSMFKDSEITINLPKIYGAQETDMKAPRSELYNNPRQNVRSVIRGARQLLTQSTSHLSPRGSEPSSPT